VVTVAFSKKSGRGSIRGIRQCGGGPAVTVRLGYKMLVPPAENPRFMDDTASPYYTVNRVESVDMQCGVVP
jgi:hypothetical protein